MAVLFFTLPLASQFFLGAWGFDDAPGIACLCLAAAAYLYFAERQRLTPIPDPAAVLDEAIRRAAAGDADTALKLLDEALRMSPRLWQAWQYRGQICIGQPDGIESALHDFTEAIRLAPGEPHLYMLRSYVLGMLGRQSCAQADLETAARLGEPCCPALASQPARSGSEPQPPTAEIR
jgi:Flp pilus assembly protein TadD